MEKKNKYIIISILTLILLIGGTFAYYIWTSSTNATINLEVCTPKVTFTGGSTINGTNLIPVTSKDNGLKKTIEVSINKVCSKTVTMNLYMTLTTLPTTLADSTFVYELYKGSTKLTSGNFSGKTQGNTLTLISNGTITTTKTTYTLYIYIDGSKDNPTTMAGQSFTFNLYSTGSNAIS